MAAVQPAHQTALSPLRDQGVFMKFEAIYKMLPLAAVVQQERPLLLPNIRSGGSKVIFD